MSSLVPVFTEMYFQTTGSNLNAGSTTSDSASVTETNGDWGNAAANRFTAASGTPFSGVVAGEWASIYNDGATVTPYIALITAVNGGGASIDLSTTSFSGTAPTTGATGKSCKVGGAWKGPNGTEAFPFNFLAYTARNTSNHSVRCNMKDGTNYSISAAITHSLTGANTAAVTFEAYTNTPGDGGTVIFDCGSPAGSTFTALTISGVRIAAIGIQIQNNGTGSPSGASGDGIRVTAGGNLLKRCVGYNIRRTALYLGGNAQFIECEAANCQTSNTASGGAFGGITVASTGATITRCISHHNAGGSNAHGFVFSSPGTMKDCVAAFNTGDGCRDVSTGVRLLKNCDFYSNGGSNLNLASGPANPVIFHIENCNFLKATGYGIIYRANTIGTQLNCGFGSGTEANGSGNYSMTHPVAVRGINTITYAANTTPWNDPANGDFRVSLAAAKGTGAGRFRITKAGYGPTRSYSDVGACQHQHS